LIVQAKNGDRAALEKLVLRHQAWIYNIAVRMVVQPQDAEEVTQEVLVMSICCPTVRQYGCRPT
jgi:DNA-directed RNA polymerase specialized sigma24 family protein